MGSETVNFCGPLTPDSNSTFPFALPGGVNLSSMGFPPFPPMNFSGGFPFNITVTPSPFEERYMDFKHYSYNVVLPVIFVLGIIGNTLNIIIFSKSRFRHSLDEVEKSATAGLVALAVSDLLFCLVGFPAAFTVSCASCSVAAKTILFYYNTLRGTFLNVFLFSSTWLTVAISIERYLAVCYPLHVRWLVRVKRTILIDISIYVVSILFNIPGFLKWKYLYSSCPNGDLYITHFPNAFFHTKAFKSTYHALWAVLGAFIPIVILSFCNIRLIIEVSRSKARADRADKRKYTTSRITIILIAVIVLHIFLVCPSIIVLFLSDFVTPNMPRATYFKLLTALTTFNVAQTINFAINFVLYCVMSKAFRENLTGRTCKIHSTLKSTPRTSSEETKHKYQLVDMTTNQTSTTRGTPSSSRANGNCLT